MREGVDPDRVAANYYVYALQDPRGSVARPFYIGKGVGARKDDHLRRPDGSAKWARIEEIRKAGHEPLVLSLVTSVTESEALQIEAQLIAAFGCEGAGGVLTNQVRPSGVRKGKRQEIVVPWGIEGRAQAGLDLLREAVFELLVANPGGLTNAEVASFLGLRSSYGGGSKDYLSYSLLGLLLAEGKIHREGRKHIASVQRKDV